MVQYTHSTVLCHKLQIQVLGLRISIMRQYFVITAIILFIKTNSVVISPNFIDFTLFYFIVIYLLIPSI